MRWLQRALIALVALLATKEEVREATSPERRAVRRLKLRWLTRGVLLLMAVGLLGLCSVVFGLVPIKASSGHWAITAWFLHFSMKRSVATHSLGTEVPPLEDPRLVLVGAGHYETGCRFCHGAPGEPPPPIPLHMTPHPPQLSSRVQEYDDAELFYIVRHGVKFTGMPAWPAPEREDEVWALVAFLRRLPQLDAEGYHRLVHGEEEWGSEVPHVVGHVCARCHGVQGHGREGAFPRLAAQRPEYLRQSLQAYAAGGRHSGIMQPVAAALGKAELEEVVQWYARQQPAAGGGQAAGGRGEEIARRGVPERRVPACAGCHGPGRTPRHAAYPRLAGQEAGYLEQQLKLFVDGKRGGTQYSDIMHTVATRGLSPEDIREVARYYAGLPAE